MKFFKLNINEEYRNLIIIGVFYVIFLLLFIGKFDFNPSATVEFSQKFKNDLNISLPNLSMPSDVVIYQNDGFDGQYYYTLALNHSLYNLKNMPMGANFIQRLLYPLLALVLSLGFAPLLPIMFIIINIMAVLISSYILMLLLKKYSANLNWVFLWSFSVGLLITASTDLTEPLMLVFIALSVYFWEQNKHYLATIFLSLSFLTKELAIAFYAAMLLYFIIFREWKKLLIYSLAIIPFCIWELILFLNLGTIPILKSSGAFSITTLPLLDYLNKIPKNFIDYVLNPLFGHVKSTIPFNLLNYLSEINKVFSSLPVVLFTIISLIIIVYFYFKDRNITIFTILLVSQASLILLLQKDLLVEYGVGAVGRYALGMYFFSILYFAERKKKYNTLLIILIILSSLAYFIQKVLTPTGGFFIT
jgi:hypothetical protein